MILSDFDLRNYIKSGRLKIVPFDESIIRENGLDLRLGNTIARLKRTSKILDVEKTYEANIEDFYEVEEGSEFIIYPNERVLLHTLEYIKLPPELMGFVNLRSTYARLGMALPPTIIDGGFEGQLTIELIGGSFPVKLYAGKRFIHVVFAKLTSPVEKPYQGIYQGQRGVTLPKIFGAKKFGENV